MKLDFSTWPLRDNGFSERPMTILDPDPKALLCAVLEMALIETGNPAARERWQKIQLRNLLRHAGQRSAFWRQRIANPDAKLTSLPVMTRQDAIRQVASEGSLLWPADNVPTKPHSTSGSSGIPVRFFASAVNGQYNSARYAAQYFIEGRDLSLNRTELKQGDGAPKHGFSVSEGSSWLGLLDPLLRTGANKQIEYVNPDIDTLVAELRKKDIGYLLCPPLVLESIFSVVDPGFLKASKTSMWIAFGETVSQDLVKTFSDLKIPIRANYSAHECGPIGFECAAMPGHYHVATSNVMIETGDASHEIGGSKVGNVLVTHLHSYATPFIRYDIGDFASLRENCPCGNPGPTLFNLVGRSGSVLRHRNGRLSPFHIRARELTALARFTEFRMRQIAFEKIVIEIGGRSELKPDEVTALTRLLKDRAGPEFEIEVTPRETIDWQGSRKRPGFQCEIPA
jgi:phenylacetate-coenzyme A ligase PaaK-like adenylate-forming protein